jgi:putative copper export protein
VAGAVSAAEGSLAPALTALRLSLHVAAATVWVGGQIVLVGLLPTVRRLSDEAPRSIARAFARLSWPAFAVLVATGIWNIAATHPSHQTTAWRVVLGVKIAVVALAGLAAYLHGRSTSRAGLAVWGSLSGSAALVALVLGVLLAG